MGIDDPVTRPLKAYAFDPAKSIDWRRLRVASQLKAAVEQLDSLVLAFEESAKHISEHQWPEVSARVRIVEFFRQHTDDGRIPPEVVPKDWTRFADNVYRLVGAAVGSGRGDRVAARVGDLLPHLDAEIRNLTLPQFPRSVSLFQFVLGVLAQKELIKPPLVAGYFPLVTEDLLTLFPAVDGFSPRFDFLR